MQDNRTETNPPGHMIENRRQFVRVDDLLPMKALPVQTGDIDSLRERIRLERHLSGPAEDVESAVWNPDNADLYDALDGQSKVFRYLFERIEYKLDLLLQLSARQQMAQHGIDGAVRCDLSGGGIRFESAEAFPVGQAMEIQLYLRDVPPIVVKCLAQVVRTEDNDDPRWGDMPYRVSVKFTDIVEADRERIIRYVFGIQRQTIRDRTSQN